MPSPRMGQNIWQTFKIHILAPGIKQLSIHPCWACACSPAVDQVSIKTSHVKNYSPTHLEANTELQNTLLLSISTIQKLFRPFQKLFLRGVVPAPRGTSARSQMPSPATSSLGLEPVRTLQLKTGPSSRLTKPIRTSFPASSSENLKRNERSNCFASWETDPSHAENTDPELL